MKKLLICLLPVSAVMAMANPNSGQLPGGSWVNDCNSSQATFKNGELQAFCNSGGGLLGGTLSKLDYSVNCKPGATVSYKSGELMCDTDDSSNMNNAANNNERPTWLPGGNWVNYCNKNQATFKNGQLQAFCDGNNGLMGGTLSRLDYSTNCKPGSKVNYKNGELMCAGRHENVVVPTSDGLPNGNWRNSCDVQSASMTASKLFRADCNVKGLFGMTVQIDKKFNYGGCPAGSGINYENENFSCDSR